MACLIPEGLPTGLDSSTTIAEVLPWPYITGSRVCP